MNAKNTINIITMVIVMDISSDKHIKDFFIQRDISKSTQTTYLIRIGKYCEFNNKTPTKFASKHTYLYTRSESIGTELVAANSKVPEKKTELI